MNNEQREKANKKNKNCCDCLHCKVSDKSTLNYRMCFCVKTEKKANHTEAYWMKKKLCCLFDDMSA